MKLNKVSKFIDLFAVAYLAAIAVLLFIALIITYPVVLVVSVLLYISIHYLFNKIDELIFNNALKKIKEDKTRDYDGFGTTFDLIKKEIQINYNHKQLAAVNIESYIEELEDEDIIAKTHQGISVNDSCKNLILKVTDKDGSVNEHYFYIPDLMDDKINESREHGEISINDNVKVGINFITKKGVITYKNKDNKISEKIIDFYELVKDDVLNEEDVINKKTNKSRTKKANKKV